MTPHDHDSTLFSSSLARHDEAFMIDVSTSLPSFVRVKSFLSSPSSRRNSNCGAISLFIGIAFGARSSSSATDNDEENVIDSDGFSSGYSDSRYSNSQHSSNSSQDKLENDKNKNAQSETTNRQLTHLKYEAYIPMAIKELTALCRVAKLKYPSIHKMVAVHLIGEYIPVGETVLMIGCVSQNYSESCQCTEFLIRGLKGNVPIWKKECYNNEDWKKKSISGGRGEGVEEVDGIETGVWIENAEWKEKFKAKPREMDKVDLKSMSEGKDIAKMEEVEKICRDVEDLVKQIHPSPNNPTQPSVHPTNQGQMQINSNQYVHNIGRNPQSPSTPAKPRVRHFVLDQEICEEDLLMDEYKANDDMHEIAKHSHEAFLASSINAESSCSHRIGETRSSALKPRKQHYLQPNSHDDMDAIPSDYCEDNVPQSPKGKTPTRQHHHHHCTESYTLGQNRHHQKMIEMIEAEESEEANDNKNELNSIGGSSCGTNNFRELFKKTMMPLVHHSPSSLSTTAAAADTLDKEIATFCGSSSSTKKPTPRVESPDNISFTAGMMPSHVLLRLKRWHLSVAIKRQNEALECGRSFDQFALLSIDPATIEEDDFQVNTGSSRYLDPFVTKKVELLDHFPGTFSESDVEAGALAMFCFPLGLRVRLIPRCVEESARRIGWLGKTGDNFQVQGFTDFSGSLSYGVAITIREELIGDDAENVASMIARHRERRRASTILSRWWRGQYSKDLVWGTGDSVSGYYPPISQEARRLGREAYDAMVNASSEGDVCIVEKSYVFTGTPLKEQSMFFCALQNLIEMERKSMSINVNKNKGETEARKRVLSELHSSLFLNYKQSRVSYPCSDSEHMSAKLPRFELDISVPMFNKINLPLPLPEVSGQWGLSRLLLKFKDSGLIVLLEMLLLERSVLVIGKTTGEVSACTTALLEMLEPYKWSSAFIPLLPIEMLDFVSSPVPFIAGVVVDNKKQLRAINSNPSIKEAMLHGLSIVNLVTGILNVTREKKIAHVLRRSFRAVPELSRYYKRLTEYRQSPASTLRSLELFIRMGPSRGESLTIRKIKVVIKKYLSGFTKELNGHSNAWKKFGRVNKATGTFDFCPHKFIQPLKDHMIFRIQFQEIMAHTQLFIGYIEELQEAQQKREELLSGPAARFIAQWVEMHLHTNNAPFCVWNPPKR